MLQLTSIIVACRHRMAFAAVESECCVRWFSSIIAAVPNSQQAASVKGRIVRGGQKIKMATAAIAVRQAAAKHLQNEALSGSFRALLKMFFKDEILDEAEDKNFLPRKEVSETQGAIILLKVSEVFILPGV